MSLSSAGGRASHVLIIPSYNTGPKVYETIIPRNTRVAEAPSHGKPILLYDYDCAGSQAYIRLATEIIERERRFKAA